MKTAKDIFNQNCTLISSYYNDYLIHHEDAFIKEIQEFAEAYHQEKIGKLMSILQDCRRTLIMDSLIDKSNTTDKTLKNLEDYIESIKPKLIKDTITDVDLKEIDHARDDYYNRDKLFERK